MVKIYSVTDYNVTCEHLTVGAAIKNLENYYKDCTSFVADFEDWKRGKIVGDSGNNVLVILEVGYPQHAGLTTKDLKKYYPNAKFVGLACDTMWYIAERRGFQWHSPYDLDLWLETMSDAKRWYDERDVPTDVWKWTASESLLRTCEDFLLNNPLPRIHDFIGVYHPCTIENKGSYRNRMVNYIRDNGMTFTQGGGQGHQDNDNFPNLMKNYVQSWFTLGTTSHNDPRFFGMKGFRDWIGPALGTVLLYDNYKDVISYFGDESLLPLYKYGDFPGLLSLAKNLQENCKLFRHYLDIQREWAWDNTIEKQLVKILDKHNIVSRKELVDENSLFG